MLKNWQKRYSVEVSDRSPVTKYSFPAMFISSAMLLFHHGLVKSTSDISFQLASTPSDAIEVMYAAYPLTSWYASSFAITELVIAVMKFVLSSQSPAVGIKFSFTPRASSTVRFRSYIESSSTFPVSSAMYSLSR